MRVTIEYGAQAKKAAGVASEEVELDGLRTVEEVIFHVAQTRGNDLRSLLFDGDGKLQRSILLFIGDHQVRGEAGVDLKDRDVITILSPISGGA